MLARLAASLGWRFAPTAARITEIEARLQALASLEESVEACPGTNGTASQEDSGTGRGRFAGLVREAAARHGLDPALLHAVIRAESDYDPRAVSRAGAVGLMQIMPETARAFGVQDPFDPAQNTEAGARELQGYLERFADSSAPRGAESAVELALAAYNAGPGNVRKYGGIPPFRETQAYVPRVLEYWRQERNRGVAP